MELNFGGCKVIFFTKKQINDNIKDCQYMIGYYRFTRHHSCFAEYCSQCEEQCYANYNLEYYKDYLNHLYYLLHSKK